MACNENIIKNMANEVTRNCQVQNVNVEAEFVAYLIELLLLNPKYGKLFSTTLNRNCLAYFVEECGAMILRGGTCLNTLKMQFIMRSNYDRLDVLIDKHQENVDMCLKPLVIEMLECEPEVNDEAEMRKLYRKIAIYIILASGLGNPAIIMNLKEGMCALESVFSIDELPAIVAMPRSERMGRVEELLEIVSGVRLFNRDCRKGGDMIPDLPFDLVDAGKACLSSLSNSLISVMQRINMLTTAIEDRVKIQDETGNVYVSVLERAGLAMSHYLQIFELLIFNRQYEIYIRRMLMDVQTMVDTSQELVMKYKSALEELHAAVKYKAAVPVDTVFPLFTKLWLIWRAMQNTMFLVSTVNRLMAIINGIQDHNKIPHHILDKMLSGKTIINDQERLCSTMHMESDASLHDTSSAELVNEPTPSLMPVSDTCFSLANLSDSKHIAFLGFCTMCLNVGAFVPCNLNVGLIRYHGERYGFCNVKEAMRFTKDPHRYMSEVLDFARNNPHVINLLNIEEHVRNVRDIEQIVTKYEPKIKLFNRAIQTEVHAVEEYIEHNYSWDLWEWKRRACQWANIVNCKTHSTQTIYSHLRSEIHCQTFEPRDKCLQTKKTTGMNTNTCNFFLFGLRGKRGEGQHSMDMVPEHSPEKAKASPIFHCTWPCVGAVQSHSSLGSSYLGSQDSEESNKVFYRPD
ncbi:cilia- and flagella-associated protein 206-like isoform X2 [Pectinophora gossypiella]|uniref:cilia- and flagella-associated protein 206-like isoform X2 n=1 Tax=Pectinophora gossypiella TaxID=13191 RepID=UPI00214F1C6C|nr:cilia- and flagella-associated protein 206-like isoform X2 [Pectinophora gossypiella]